MAWDSNDIPSQVCVNPNIKWKDIEVKFVEIVMRYIWCLCVSPDDKDEDFEDENDIDF